MSAQDFLYSALENISKEFPQVRIKYSFNSVISTHIVVLLPLEEYQGNAALDDAWIPLSFRFRELFPEDEIAFVSSDSSLSNGQSIYEFNNGSNAFIIPEDFFETFSVEAFDYSFSTRMQIGAITIGAPIAGILDYPKENIRIDDGIDNSYQAAA